MDLFLFLSNKRKGKIKMNKSKLSKFILDARSAVSKHSPEILMGIGIAGMITTTVLAVKATPKALRLIEAAERDKYDELHPDSNIADREPLTAVETVKAAWKPYIPALVTGVTSVGCLIGGNSIHARRNAALATAYQISTTALKEYKAKVVETIGEKKERVIHDKLAEDKIKEKPITKSEVIFTGKGETNCYDMLSGRPFKSDRNKIEKAMNNLNYRMTGGQEMCISLNEFYYAIGLPPIPIGDDIGWRIDKGLIDIYFASFLLEDDEPYMTVEFLIPPEHGFNKLY